jgi:hypothetical protein
LRAHQDGNQRDEHKRSFIFCHQEILADPAVFPFVGQRKVATVDEGKGEGESRQD